MTKPSTAQRTYLGAGKLAELVRELAELKPDTVIFDDELTPGQLRTLEKACRVIHAGPRVLAGRWLCSCS